MDVNNPLKMVLIGLDPYPLHLMKKRVVLLPRLCFFFLLEEFVRCNANLLQRILHCKKRAHGCKWCVPNAPLAHNQLQLGLGLKIFAGTLMASGGIKILIRVLAGPIECLGVGDPKITFFEWPPNWHIVLHFIWHSIWHVFWHSIYLTYILTLSLELYLAFYLAYILAFYLRLYVAFYLTNIFSHSIHSLWHVFGPRRAQLGAARRAGHMAQCPGVPAASGGHNAWRGGRRTRRRRRRSCTFVKI